MPLSINSVTSYFPCWKPTCSEFEDGDVPRIVFTAETPYCDPSDLEFAEHEGEMTDFRGALVNEAAAERGPKMVIREVSLGTSWIDVLSDDIFGLMMEININVVNEFSTTAMINLETHKIMRVGTYSSKRSLAINHEMVQARWGIHPALAGLNKGSHNSTL